MIYLLGQLEIDGPQLPGWGNFLSYFLKKQLLYDDQQKEKEKNDCLYGILCAYIGQVREALCRHA